MMELEVDSENYNKIKSISSTVDITIAKITAAHFILSTMIVDQLLTFSANTQNHFTFFFVIL